jgi:hypothetical protein
VLSAAAFAMLAAFSLAPAARESVSSDVQITCKDGTVSPSKKTRGACSGHGGVAKTEASSSASTSTDDSKHTRVLGAGASKVWVNESTKVYHCSGDPFYGKTKRGEYMSESDAKDKGFRPDHGKTCAERDR